MKLSDRLAAHAFTKAVLEDSARATKDLYPRGSAFEIDADPVRELTEREFYLSACGYSLSHLLNLIGQLERIPAYLVTSRKSKALAAAGVTRVTDLVYHWENYLIRARSLEDRALQLVSDVFHLGINNKHVAFHLVRQNVHVDVNPVAGVLDRLRRLVSPVAPERNRLIHERGLLDEEFRRLEFWLLAYRIPGQRDYATGRYLTEVREIAPRKAADVEEFVSVAGELLVDLFGALETRYAHMLARLSVT